MSTKGKEEPAKDKSQGKAKGNKEEADDLTEEDRELKEGLELSVERLNDPVASVQQAALDHLKTEIKSSTSSMTSVPKPLKFLRPHYGTLKQRFEQGVTDAGVKTSLADVLAVLAMTMGAEGERESLKFKLAGDASEIGEWGHEFVRNLAGEIGEEFTARQDAAVVEAEAEGVPVQVPDLSDLMGLVDLIVPYNMKHNAEHEAADLLMEVERIKDIVQHTEPANYSRVCLYLLGCAAYVPEPEDAELYGVVEDLFALHGKSTDRLCVALKLDQPQQIAAIFEGEQDQATKRQLAFILARATRFIYDDEEDDEQELLTKIIGNGFQAEYFHYLGQDLDILEPKEPEDIYKSSLTSRPVGADSAKQNLAASFVNAFVNLGFGTDKLITDEDDGAKWIYKNKGLGQLCSTASLGMLFMWDADAGCQALDKYSYTDNENIKAGNFLGVGVACSMVRNLFETALGLLSEALPDDNPTIVRVSAVLGLGLAYAGTGREDVGELLTPIFEEDSPSMELVAITSLALGLIFVGTANADIASTLVNSAMFDRTETDLKSSMFRFVALGLGLLFLGKGEEVDVHLETVQAILEGHPAPRNYAEVTMETCAYAGTGNVLKVQKMLHHCVEHLEKDDGYQGVAVIGLGLIAMGEELGCDMLLRSMDHLLQYGEPIVRRAVPLALGLTNLSNPRIRVMDTLSKLSHDHDGEVASSAIFAMGLLGAGTNNSRLAQMLRLLAEYYYKDTNQLFVVRIAQGLLHAGKGTVSLNPWHQNGLVMNKAGIGGVLACLHAVLDYKDVLSSKPYLLFSLVPGLVPKYLVTLDENMEMLSVDVRVGKAVDTVGQAGKPKTITGFQTYTTPVLLRHNDRAELATEEWIPLSSALEGVVILRKNPEYK